jgi:hypothetical protein
MAYQAENIINIVTYLSSSGLGTANFGAGMIFADSDSTDAAGFAEGTYRDYASPAEVAVDFDILSDPYLASLAWFSALPKPLSLRIYRRVAGDTVAESFNDAINKNIWFYWFDFETSIRAVKADVLALQVIADANGKFYAGTTNDADVRDVSVTTDIVSQSVAQGARRTYLLSHATAPYAGFELAAIFSRVNFSAADSTITGEYKKLPGIIAENLNTTAYSAMKQKGAVFYTVVETGGQQDNGRIINSKTTSTFDEWIDDVFNLDAFVNFLRVALYNTLAGKSTKWSQTPAGQVSLNNAAKQVGEQFISNGYLGARNFVDEITGDTKLSRGYELLTRADEILDLSDADRADRKSAPIRMRLFRAGAIHTVDVALYVE